MAKFSFIVLCLLLGVSFAKEVTRSKRQLNSYYMCGNYPNSYVSQFPCSNVGNGCGGYSNCNGLSTVGVLPSSFYYPSNNCNSGCNNFNCNQYNGMYINNQYVAYAYGSNQYSPCASSCCGNNYNYNGGLIGVGSIGFNNGYNNIGSGVYPTPLIGGIGNGVFSNGGLINRLFNSGVGVCGGSEASTGYCSNGFCSDGMQCVGGNICCRCAIGASNGRCTNGIGCGAGYTCSQNGYCCASTAFNGVQLKPCVNNECPVGFQCGSYSGSDLCYPSGK